MDQNQADWQVWYDRHGPALLLFARQLTTSLAEAEDAVHDGFVRYWKNRGRVEHDLAYLYRSIRSAALDQRRSADRRDQRERGRACSDRSGVPEPWQRAARDESEQRLRDVIAKLGQPLREVLVMKVWGGLTFDQIAEAVAIPRSTAAARYSAAIKALKTALPAEEHSL